MPLELNLLCPHQQNRPEREKGACQEDANKGKLINNSYYKSTNQEMEELRKQILQQKHQFPLHH